MMYVEEGMNKRVLVTYGWCRNSWAVLRNLGKHKLEVYAGGPSKKFMAGASRYCKKSFCYPSFYTHPKEFIESVVHFIRKNDIGTYIPVHEEILVISKYIDAFPDTVNIPISAYDKIYTLYNKKKSGELADRLNIPVPKTVRLAKLQDLEERLSDVIYPAVIKLQNSNGAKGIRYVHSDVELVNEYRNLIRDFNIRETLPIIQEYVEGTMYAVSLLCNNGIPVAEFVRKNIREKSYEGGTCTKCSSVYAPGLVSYAKKMLSSLSFTGVAMLEFKVSENGKCWLIDVNPRYWGTVSHDIDCGIEFPYYQYCLAGGMGFETARTYREGIKSRWIIGDIIGFIDSTKKAQKKFKNCLKYLKIDDRYFMDFKIDDPLPFFVQSIYYLKQFLKYKSTNPFEDGMIG